MADTTFITTSGQTIARELLVAYLNTGSSGTPTWSAIGTRVDDSSAEYDWDADTTRDIIGNTWGVLKKPVITQEFDPVKLDAGDAAYLKLWNAAIKDHDAQALTAMDVLIVHYYTTGNFAERYSGCMIEVTGLGGEGGGDLEMPFTITYGGARTLGTASKAADTGVVTFTPAA